MRRVIQTSNVEKPSKTKLSSLCESDKTSTDSQPYRSITFLPTRTLGT